MTRLRWLLLVVAVLVILAACQRGGQARPSPIQHDFSGLLPFGGLTHTYLGHLLSAYDGVKALP